MSKSFRELMAGIIDYAGLFPPAELSLEKALKNYINYIKSSDNWMLSKFIIPAGLLYQVTELLVEVDDKLRFSVIISNSEKDLENIIHLKNSLKGIDVLSLEIKPQVMLENLINKFDFIRSNINKNIQIFVESNVNPDYDLIEKLTMFKNENIYIGYKLRTGGVTQESFPSVDLVASVIKSCAENKIPFKATAGLHHPFTHFNTTVNIKMYGFINVFTAGIFAMKYNLNATELMNIIQDENPNNFIFKDNLVWKNYEISSDEISEIRRNYFTTFGSCSFDEPREDLRNLKLL